MKKLKDISGWCLLASLLVIWSCNTAKKAQRQLDLATNKVMSNYAAMDKVGHEWAKTNPCANDTIIKSKSDTVTVTNTAYLSGDTVTVGDTVRITKTLQNTVLKYIHDTVTNNITDKRALGIVNDSLSYYKGLLIQQKAATDTALKAVKDMKKDRSKWRLWFWLLVAGLGIYIFKMPIIGLIKKLII